MSGQECKCGNDPVKGQSHIEAPVKPAILSACYSAQRWIAVDLRKDNYHPECQKRNKHGNRPVECAWREKKVGIGSCKKKNKPNSAEGCQALHLGKHVIDERHEL